MVHHLLLRLVHRLERRSVLCLSLRPSGRCVFRSAPELTAAYSAASLSVLARLLTSSLGVESRLLHSHSAVVYLLLTSRRVLHGVLHGLLAGSVGLAHHPVVGVVSGSHLLRALPHPVVDGVLSHEGVVCSRRSCACAQCASEGSGGHASEVARRCLHRCIGTDAEVHVTLSVYGRVTEASLYAVAGEGGVGCCVSAYLLGTCVG